MSKRPPVSTSRYCKLVSDLVATRAGSTSPRELHLRPVRASSGYVIPPEELPKVDRLYERYGIDSGSGETEGAAPTPEPDFP